MRDFLEEFRRQNSRRHLTILTLSLTMAIILNAVYYGTPVGGSLRASLQQSTTTTAPHGPDLVIQSAGTGSDMLTLSTTTTIRAATGLTLTLLTDPSQLTITDIPDDEAIPNADSKATIATDLSTPGMVIVHMSWMKNTDLPPHTTLLHISYNKKTTSTTTLNVAESNFQSNGNTYDLTNQSFEF